MITRGQVHDVKLAPQLVSILPASEYLIADRGYASEALRNQNREKGEIPICPRNGKQKMEMMIWTVIYINIDILWKMLLQDSNTSEQSPQGMIN